MYLLTYFWAFAQSSSSSSSSSWTRGARAVVKDLKFFFVGCDAIVSARATYLPTLPTSYLTDWSLGIDECTWVVARTRYVRVYGSDDNRQWRQWRRRWQLRRACPACLSACLCSASLVWESPYMYRVLSGDIRACRYLPRYRRVMYVYRFSFSRWQLTGVGERLSEPCVHICVRACVPRVSACSLLGPLTHIYIQYTPTQTHQHR